MSVNTVSVLYLVITHCFINLSWNDAHHQTYNSTFFQSILFVTEIDLSVGNVHSGADELDDEYLMYRKLK